MRMWDLFFGITVVQITTAAPENLLQSLNSAGVCLRNVQYLDALTIRLDLERKDYKSARELSEKTGAHIKIVERKGIYWSVKRLITRPVLLMGILTIFLLTLLLPTRILFVDIKGNEMLPASLVLEKAELCGIKFGASRRYVRSEATKNQLLSLLPDLRWAGVNTYGCVAVITVQEKPDTQTKYNSDAIQHVVAAKDGIIAEMTILRGAAQCERGQAVVKDQILVSGYIDHGISIEGTCADAEILGYTGNVLYMLTPTDRYVREEMKTIKTRYQLLVGKKLINFSKDSGISGVECVRMYEERYLILPGGFQLPVALVQEKTVLYSGVIKRYENVGSYTWVKGAAEEYLRSQMLSGEILHSNTITEVNDGFHMLYGTYQCRELIGRVRSEEKMIADE